MFRARLVWGIRFVAGVLLLQLATSACSSGIAPTSDPATSAPAFAQAGKQAGQVSFTMTPEVRSYASAHPSFNHDRLQAVIIETLRADSLVAAAADPSLSSITVTITDARLRPGSAAIWLGPMAGDDRLTASVTVTAPDGSVLQRFIVSASYSLGGVTGAHRTRTEWLYEALAKRIVEGLRGTSKS